MERPASGVEDVVAPETLRKVRVPFVRRVTLRPTGRVEELFAVDLGLRGIFVERSQPLPRGEVVEVQFLLPGNAIPIAATGRVAWWHPAGARLVSKSLPSGLGVEFEELSSWDADRLRHFILEHLRREPKRRRLQPQWPDSVGGEDAEP
jgi:hypothetical protein